MAELLIDCDIHPALPSSAALLPYLDDHWQEQVTTRGIDGLDLQSYLPSMPLSGRPDWRRGDEKPGSNFDMLQRQALDGFGSTYAICNCLYGTHAVYDPYLASAFSKATNDWIANEWMARDKRLRAHRSSCRCRRPILPSRRSNDERRTSASSRCWSWRKAR